MTPEQFVYWLQGCLEITDPKSLGEKEIQVIKDHIALVLKKETPDRIRTIPENKIDESKSIKTLQEFFEKTQKDGATHSCDGPLSCGRPYCVKCKNKMTFIC